MQRGPVQHDPVACHTWSRLLTRHAGVPSHADPPRERPRPHVFKSMHAHLRMQRMRRGRHRQAAARAHTTTLLQPAPAGSRPRGRAWCTSRSMSMHFRSAPPDALRTRRSASVRSLRQAAAARHSPDLLCCGVVRLSATPFTCCSSPRWRRGSMPGKPWTIRCRTVHASNTR